MRKGTCPCGNQRSSEKSGYCRDCKNRKAREYRRTHEKSPRQRIKDNCRSYTHSLIKRGKLKKGNCEECGDVNSQAHHPDYRFPWVVTWLCRLCHAKLHVEHPNHGFLDDSGVTSVGWKGHVDLIHKGYDVVQPHSPLKGKRVLKSFLYLFFHSPPSRTS